MNKEYIKSEYCRMHDIGLFDGGSLKKHLPEIRSLINELRLRSILDYGCGKAKLHKKEKLATEVYLYDPYYRPYNEEPIGTYDMVICTDVLEHVPEKEIVELITKLISYTRNVLYLSISTKKARKTFKNGENVHITVRPQEWWEELIEDVAAIYEIKHNKYIKIVRHYD